MPAYFFAEDAFSATLPEKVQEALSAGGHGGKKLDIISCQFSFHYAFSDEETAKRALGNVSQLLRPGGVFIGTFINSEEILKRRREHGKQFGNSVYNVEFENKDSNGKVFGDFFTFSIEHCVNNATEPVVAWSKFVAMADSVNLSLHSTFGFEDFYKQFYKEFTPEWDILVNKNVATETPTTMTDVLSFDEIEATTLYRTFTFIKKLS